MSDPIVVISDEDSDIEVLPSPSPQRLVDNNIRRTPTSTPVKSPASGERGKRLVRGTAVPSPSNRMFSDMTDEEEDDTVVFIPVEPKESRPVEPVEKASNRRAAKEQSGGATGKVESSDDDFGPSRTVNARTSTSPLAPLTKPKPLIKPRIIRKPVTTIVKKEDPVDLDEDSFFNRSRRTIEDLPQMIRQEDGDSTEKPTGIIESDPMEEDEVKVKRGRKRKRKTASVVESKPVLLNFSDDERKKSSNNISDTDASLDAKAKDSTARDRSITPPPQMKESEMQPRKRLPHSSKFHVVSSDDEDLNLQSTFIDPDLLKLMQQQGENAVNEKVSLQIQAYDHPMNLIDRRPVLFAIKSLEKLEAAMTSFASQVKQELQSLVFLYHGTVVSKFANCYSMKANSGNVIIILEAMTATYYEEWKVSEQKKTELKFRETDQKLEQLMEQAAAKDSGGHDDDDMIWIKMNMKNKQERVQVSKSETTIALLIEQCRELCNLPADLSVKAKFDGEVLDVDETLESLDVDNDDQIDFLFSVVNVK